MTALRTLGLALLCIADMLALCLAYLVSPTPFVRDGALNQLMPFDAPLWCAGAAVASTALSALVFALAWPARHRPIGRASILFAIATASWAALRLLLVLGELALAATA